MDVGPVGGGRRCSGVPDAEEPSNGLSGPIPIRPLVSDRKGELISELLVWVTDGVLSALEYVWFTDEPPVALPSPNQISIACQTAGEEDV